MCALKRKRRGNNRRQRGTGMSKGTEILLGWNDGKNMEGTDRKQIY